MALVGLHDITDTTSQKSASEENVLEGQAPFCYNFSAKDV